ncbi:MAG TPA: right-handed parallel beta-helix repeat-containing protein [Mycobacteriales bacterium]|nr:right-handed parallel beta-helix repeat-containing protein [Mycobacteriales bacterium]
MRHLAYLILVGALGAVGAGLVPAAAVADPPRTFYVSATGDDSHDGTSPTTAWRTLQPLDSRDLAGDTVLLEGGSAFTGPLDLDSQDSGVTVGSFGSGRARIRGQGTAAVMGYDVAAVTVRDLDLVGDAAAFTHDGGLNFYSDRPAGQRLSGITISDVAVRHFKDGVEIGGANPGSGFAHVSIADVKAIGNRDTGIITYGPAFDPGSPSYANHDVAVVRSTASRNLGNPTDKVHNSGNGIVLGSVDGGSVTRSTARANGLHCVAPEGPAGIWTYDSHDVRITYNTSTGNRTGGTADGDGFDLDQNVSDSYLEHNTSSDNDGAGYLVFAGQNTATEGNFVRWNSSERDAANNNWYGGITLAGNVHSVSVAGNTVDTTQSPSHAPALAVKSGVTGAKIGKNTLRSATGHAAVARG